MTTPEMMVRTVLDGHHTPYTSNDPMMIIMNVMKPETMTSRWSCADLDQVNSNMMVLVCRTTAPDGARLSLIDLSSWMLSITHGDLDCERSLLLLTIATLWAAGGAAVSCHEHELAALSATSSCPGTHAQRQRLQDYVLLHHGAHHAVLLRPVQRYACACPGDALSQVSTR